MIENDKYTRIVSVWERLKGNTLYSILKENTNHTISLKDVLCSTIKLKNELYKLGMVMYDTTPWNMIVLEKDNTIYHIDLDELHPIEKSNSKDVIFRYCKEIFALA